MGNSSPSGEEKPQWPYVGCTADPAWQRAGLAEATIFDIYEIGGLLGSGSFGQVRLCWPLNEAHEDQKYAVKVVDTKSEVFRQATAFISPRQEANILKAVKHPHIVELVDVFEKERFLFLVLECIQGGELFSAFADPNVTVTEGSVATVGRQLFGALRHLHEQRVVHRDVKAENILLASHPGRTNHWHIKLIDFGLSMRMEQPACLFSSCRDQDTHMEELICGTAYYCAPEVWINDYSPKVDVWAAGVVMYLILLGTYPFRDPDAAKLESMICNLDLLPTFKATCQKECPDYQISPGAKRTLAELLAKEPENRPHAAAVLQLPWLKASKQRRSSRARCTEPRQRELGPSKLPSADEMEGQQGSEYEPNPIPMPIRAKAGRAAARPPVDPSTEQSRTKDLEALKRRASVAGSSNGPGSVFGSKVTESTDWMGSSCSPLSNDDSALAVDFWARSPIMHSSDFSAECQGKKGMQMAVLNIVEHDPAPTDISLTDSDVDDMAAVCSCR